MMPVLQTKTARMNFRTRQVGSSALHKISSSLGVAATRPKKSMTKTTTNAVTHLSTMATTPRCSPSPTPCIGDLSSIAMATRGCLDTMVISDEECDITGPFCSSMIYPQGSTPKPKRKRMQCRHRNNNNGHLATGSKLVDDIGTVSTLGGRKDLSAVTHLGGNRSTLNGEATLNIIEEISEDEFHSARLNADSNTMIGKSSGLKHSLTTIGQSSDYLKHSLMYTSAVDSDATAFMQQPILKKNAITSTRSTRVTKGLDKEKKRSILNKMKEFKRNLRYDGKGSCKNVLAVL